MLWDRSWRRDSRGKLVREARWSSRVLASVAEGLAAVGLVPVEQRLVSGGMDREGPEGDLRLLALLVRLRGWGFLFGAVTIVGLWIMNG
jgi:hypothetical protein